MPSPVTNLVNFDTPGLSRDQNNTLESLKNGSFEVNEASNQSKGLIAAWPLNAANNSYPLARDLVGVSHGIANNTPTRIINENEVVRENDWRAGATNFVRANSQWFDLPSSTYWLAHTSGSISLWFKLLNGFSSRTLQMFSLSNGTNDNFWRVAISETGSDARVRVSSFGGPSDTVDMSNRIVQNNTWHHVVVTASGTSWKIYFDGVDQILSIAAGSNSGEWFGHQGHTTFLRIAASWLAGSGFFSFDGALANILIYDRVLTQKDVTELYKFPHQLYKPLDEVDITKKLDLIPRTSPLGFARIEEINRQSLIEETDRFSSIEEVNRFADIAD